MFKKVLIADDMDFVIVGIKTELLKLGIIMLSVKTLMDQIKMLNKILKI